MALLLWLQALVPAYHIHLRSDTDGFYFQRARYFLEHGHLSNLGYNEYQPGAIVFFLLLSPWMWFEISPNAYALGLVATNILLAWLSIAVWRTRFGWQPALVASLVLLVTGPLVLYRFELWLGAMLVPTIAWLLEKRYGPASITLALATLTKIFPVILTPYLALVALEQGKAHAVRAVLLFVGTIIFSLGLYCLFFQVHPKTLLGDASIHGNKPVHAESTWGSLLTWWAKLESGSFAKGKGALGIYGIDPDFVPLSTSIINYSFIPVLGLWYLYLWKKPNALRNPYTPLATIGLLLVTSKILTAQYLLWMGLLLPLLAKKIDRFAVGMIGSYLGLTIMTQYLYPLRYSELLGGFFEEGSYQHLFYLLSLRNLGLIVWTLLAIYHVRRHAS